MYVRQLHFNFIPEHIAEVKELFKNEIIPALHDAKGIIDIKLLEPVDKADSFISQSEWESQAAADAYGGSPLFTELRKKLIGFTTKEPVLKTYTCETVRKETPVMNK